MFQNETVNYTRKNRAQILIDFDSEHGKQYKRSEVAKLNRTSSATVTHVAKSFSQGDLDTVMTIARSEASNHANQKLSGEDQAHIIQLACGPTADGYAQWSLSLLEEKAKVFLELPVKRGAIGRMLKKTNLNLIDPNTGGFHQKKMPNS